MTQSQLRASLDIVTRRAMTAIGTSIMLPVSRSAPPITTRMSPRLKVTPVTTVIIPPQIFGSSPAEALIATSAPKAM